MLNFSMLSQLPQLKINPFIFLNPGINNHDQLKVDWSNQNSFGGSMQNFLPICTTDTKIVIVPSDNKDAVINFHKYHSHHHGSLVI